MRYGILLFHRQAVEDGIISGFGSSSLFSLLEAGEPASASIALLAEKVLERIKENSADIEQNQQHPWKQVRAVSDALVRIQRFCKCMLHLLNKNFDSNDQPAINNVLAFTQYVGKSIFEKATKAALTTDGYYSGLVSEVVRTAASTKTLQPKLASLQKLLESKQELNLDSITTIADGLEELRQGMRKGSLKSLDSLFLEKLRILAEEIMVLQPITASSAFVKAVMKGLAMYEKEPGVIDVSQNIQKFMTSNKSLMASGDLLKLVENAVKDRDLNPAALKDLVKKCDRTSISPALLQNMEEYLHDLLVVVCGKAKLHTEYVCLVFLVRSEVVHKIFVASKASISVFSAYFHRICTCTSQQATSEKTM